MWRGPERSGCHVTETSKEPIATGEWKKPPSRSGAGIEFFRDCDFFCEIIRNRRPLPEGP